MLLLLACKVVEAPESLSELMSFGLIHHSDEDPAWSEAFIANMVPEIAAHEAELDEGYRSENLTPDELALLAIESSTEVPGVIARTTMASNLDQVVETLAFSDMTQVFSATTAYEILEKSDKKCFLERECEFYTYTASRTIDLSLLGNATQTFDGSFRWVEQEDGEKAVIWITIAPDPAETEGSVSLFQQYSLDLLMVEGTGTLRVGAIWLEAELNDSPIEDWLLVGTSVNQMKNAADDIDKFVEDEGI